jgi:hypothetical protein
MRRRPNNRDFHDGHGEGIDGVALEDLSDLGGVPSGVVELGTGDGELLAANKSRWKDRGRAVQSAANEEVGAFEVGGVPGYKAELTGHWLSWIFALLRAKGSGRRGGTRIRLGAEAAGQRTGATVVGAWERRWLRGERSREEGASVDGRGRFVAPGGVTC